MAGHKYDIAITICTVTNLVKINYFVFRITSVNITMSLIILWCDIKTKLIYEKEKNKVAQTVKQLFTRTVSQAIYDIKKRL